MNLSNLPLGKSAVAQNPIPQNLEIIGLTAGTTVTCSLQNPFGKSNAYSIRGAMFSLREEDAKAVRCILIEN